MPQVHFGAFDLSAYNDILSGVSFTGLFNEFAQDNITATGSTQATAFQTTGQTIRVATAAAGTGILLPPSAAGLEVLVVNHGANAIQVYGNGTDTIDDIATATGVNQMVNSLVIYTCATAGKWYSEGLSTGFDKNSGLQTLSYQDGITALGTNQGTATVLVPKLITNVPNVAAGTGVLLPVSSAGMNMVINNNQGTNALLIYPNGSEKINAGGAGVGFSAAVNTITVLYCFTAGQWFTK